MKSTLIAALLVLPLAAGATVAMEPQQATQPLHEQPPAHHQLFTVKYVLRTAAPGKALPDVVMDRAAPEIAPPAGDSVPAVMLGALRQDPNMIVCYGWSCEDDTGR